MQRLLTILHLLLWLTMVVGFALSRRLDALNRTLKHNHLQPEHALKEHQQCVDEHEPRMDALPQVLDEHAQRMERYSGGLMEVLTMAGTPKQERSEFL